MAEPDLNLLRVFDTLMEQRSVTRAAERMNLTQSAVSHALGRLRAMVGDPLFLRGPAGLRPTIRAEEIAPGIRSGLDQLRGALNPSIFDPALASRRFTVASGSYFCDLVIPRLAERMRLDAPGVSLRVVPVTERLAAALDRGAIDVALGGGTIRATRGLVEEALFQEEMVWIAARDHPLVGLPFDPARIAGQHRVTISVPRPIEIDAAVDDQITQIFPRLRIESDHDPASGPVSVYDSQTAIGVVARSASVATVPRRLAAQAAAAGRIAIISPAVMTATLAMVWHERQRGDAGLAWLRNLVRICAV